VARRSTESEEAFLAAAVGRHAMPRYMVGGYEEYAVLHLVPVQGEYGTELPTQLYQRWKNARAELDAAQRAVVAHLRDSGGRDAVPEELWESQDQPPRTGRSDSGQRSL
jgi:hypothetical protein